ncbi:MAG: chorismate mutase [Tissierellia bacterium]|nr:chorismate mutase [Tissierellia bacterium]
MADIKDLRQEIDQIDRDLVQIFKRRMAWSQAIGAYKKAQGIPVLDKKREEEVLERLTQGEDESTKKAIEGLYDRIFALSRAHQEGLLGKDPEEKIYGLVGEKLGHSFSPRIHQLLSGRPYGLYEVAPEDLEAFLGREDIGGLNVTIPYKKRAFALCDQVSPRASRLKNVNSLLKRPDGSLWGDNTDYGGFVYLLRDLAYDPQGKKALVLGTGGAGQTVRAVLEDLGAQVHMVSRWGPLDYEGAYREEGVQLVVNATPVGMYPHNGKSPLDLSRFPSLEACLDLVYNPLKTALILQAQALGLPARSGLGMLVDQARLSAEIFQGEALPPSKTREIQALLEGELKNLVLIGMPSSGKTSIGQVLAQKLGKDFVDLDQEIERRTGLGIPDYFKVHGEEAFRDLESQLIEVFGKRTGQVIACGGGVVERKENYLPLKQNGTLILIKRPLEDLSSQGRPLSQKEGVEALYRRRRGLYLSWADLALDNRGIQETAGQIEALFKTGAL